MSNPQTLLQLGGADLTPAKLRDACLILIDVQNEYLSGPVAIPNALDAISNISKLLAHARRLGVPVFHIAHKGPRGGLFDRATGRGAFVAALGDLSGETVIEKPFPNAFAGTDLQARLAATGRKNLVLAGFATHMCISSTARASVDLGFRSTVDASGCASRDLPDGRGGVVAADIVHTVALAELSDRFAIVVHEAAALL